MLTRDDKQRLYNSTRWRKRRLAFLFNNPLCQYCQEQGAVKQADLVDHIDPNMDTVDEFFDSSNWQPLCTYHHSGMKAREERLAERQGKRTVRIGCGLDGFPFD